MAAPLYTVAEYAAALQGYLPSGRVWPRDVTSVQAQAVQALAPTFYRLNQAANTLLADAFPTTADQLLPEWEATVGLPDPCAGESPTLQQRLSQVVARFAGSGGQSVPYLAQFVANLGYGNPAPFILGQSALRVGVLGTAIQITEYAPFRMGRSTMGQPLRGPDWAYAWSVTAPSTNFTQFRMGQSAMGEPLSTFGNTVLQCEVQRVAPAHTVVQFLYA